MSGAYDGKQVVGIDLHRCRSVLVRMTETGERLDTVRIDNGPMTSPPRSRSAGKSTEMLHLAEHLLDRADRRPGDPVSVILPLAAGRWNLEPAALDTRGLDDETRAKAEKQSADAMLDAIDWMAREMSRRLPPPPRWCRLTGIAHVRDFLPQRIAPPHPEVWPAAAP